MSIGQIVEQMYRDVDWRALLLSHGVILAAACYLVLQFVRASRMKRRLADLEARLAERMDQRATGVEERVEGVEARSRQLVQQTDTVRHRVDQVEERIPSLYDRMEEFRITLATIFQNELGAVLGSFDSSVSAVLEHMKADLHMGIARIENIEEMVQSRQKAGKSLLGGTEAPALSEGIVLDETEPAETATDGDFDEWVATEVATAEVTDEVEDESEQSDGRSEAA